MILKDVLEKTTQFFRQKELPSARLDAELLLASALKLDRIQLYLQFDRPLRDEELSRAREMVRLRGNGEPVAYILGQKDFFGHSFVVDKNVLIPRPETEHLVETAVDYLRSREFDKAPRILDLGCGSGCIGLSILKEIPSAVLTSVDFSSGALAVATKNAEVLDVSERVTFIEGDAASEELHSRVHGPFDVIVANPPYIDVQDPATEPAVRATEPHLALFAEREGYAALQDWSRAWLTALADRGMMAMEMGTTQGPRMQEHFEQLGLLNISIVKDLSGHDRIIRGEKHHG